MATALKTKPDPQPGAFAADHSFLLSIYDEQADGMLFMGRVANLN